MQNGRIQERATMKFLIILIFTVSACLGLPQHDSSHYGYYGPGAPIGHDGRVVDTPEVADAKAAHLAAVQEAASKNSYNAPYFMENDIHGYTDAYSVPFKHPGSTYGFSEPVLFSARTYHDSHGYHGPPAPLDHEGRVVDTPEVAHAKAAHFAAFSKVASSSARAPASSAENYLGMYNSPKYNAYHGPAAPLAHNGRVVDTPEVAQARAAHLAAHANAAHSRAYDDYGIY